MDTVWEFLGEASSRSKDHHQGQQKVPLQLYVHVDIYTGRATSTVFEHFINTKSIHVLVCMGICIQVCILVVCTVRNKSSLFDIICSCIFCSLQYLEDQKFSRYCRVFLRQKLDTSDRIWTPRSFFGHPLTIIQDIKIILKVCGCMYGGW